jgi:hypothetical protein
MRHLRTFLGGAAAATYLLLSLSGLASAHVPIQVGTYEVALGWAEEPTYVGELNAVQILVADADGNPVTDLGPDDLTVVVSAGGQDSAPLSFSPAFDTEEGTGTPGDYRAPLIPTVAGDYTFHLTGTVHGNAVDETATSGEDTFDSPTGETSIQFPNPVPAISDLANRIDRVDSRSSSDASTALYVGSGLGLAGIVLGLAALALAYRNRRRPA